MACSCTPYEESIHCSCTRKAHLQRRPAEPDGRLRRRGGIVRHEVVVGIGAAVVASCSEVAVIVVVVGTGIFLATTRRCRRRRRLWSHGSFQESIARKNVIQEAILDEGIRLGLTLDRFLMRR